MQHVEFHLTCIAEKQNAVIIGRNTWDSLPPQLHPLPKRFTVVLSRQPKEAFLGAHLVCESLQEAVDSLSSPPLDEKIESIFILGGASVYEVSMLSSTILHVLYCTSCRKQ